MAHGSVTILVLVYNDAVMGRRAILSAIQQTYQNLKIKILDNGSDDQTPDMIQEFANDPRVEIIRNPANQRSEFAVRESLKVDTDYLSFLFSDDYYTTTRIEEMVAQIKDSDAAAVFSSCVYKYDNEETVTKIPATQYSGRVADLTQEQHLKHFVVGGNSLHPCAMLIRTSDYKDVGGFRPYLHRIGDMEFFSRLLIQRKVLFTNRTLQTITLWRSGRNESHTNAEEYRPIIIERGRLLENYRTPAFLAKTSQVFENLQVHLNLDTSLESRLFWTGHEMCSIPGDDFLLFGTHCMMDAYDKAPGEIEAICLLNFEKRFSRYLFDMSATPVPDRAIALAVFKLKKIARRHPLLWAVLGLLKKSSRQLFKRFIRT